MAMGHLLGIRRQSAMDSTFTSRILGLAGKPERRWLE